MVGLLINEQEHYELKAMIKSELDELIEELQKDRTGHFVIQAMEERYRILFTLLKRVAPPREWSKYSRK
jgi:hypothetical protein